MKCCVNTPEGQDHHPSCPAGFYGLRWATETDSVIVGVDESCCIVLVPTSDRPMVTDVDRLIEALTTARTIATENG